MLSAQSVTLRKVANVPNNRHRIPFARGRQERPAAREGIDTNRTYRRAHLIALLPHGSEEFIRLLEKFYGLLPLGGRQPIYYGQNVLEALMRHAKDERVEQSRGRATRDTLRKEQQRRRRRA